MKPSKIGGKDTPKRIGLRTESVELPDLDESLKTALR